MKNLKTIKSVKKWQGKKVFYRVDLNVKIGPDGRVDNKEDFKIKKIVPTLRFMLDQGAAVIVASHLGRPQGKNVKDLRLDPLADRLGKLLKKRIKKIDEAKGPIAKKEAAALKPGQVLMLENLRFYSGEEKNSVSFAKQLAELADLYVNDAFGVSHHGGASLQAITKFLPAYAGLLMQSEIKELSKVLTKPQRPLVVILGGAKISTKLGLIEYLAPQADQVLLGGGLANNFLAGQNLPVGKSLLEKKMVLTAKKIYKKYKNKIHLPVDVTVDDVKTKKIESRQKAVSEIKSYDKIIDIGTTTVRDWSYILRQAKTVIWNGPLGVIENKKSSHASRALTEFLASRSSKKTFTVIGGGETVWLVQDMGLFDDFDYVSTGGGSMIEFMQGKMLVGIKPLLEYEKAKK